MQRLSSSRLFETISDLMWPRYNTVARAKSFLCKKRGLSEEAADQELEELMDFEAGLLCHLYAEGMRGAYIRQVKHQHSDFLKRITDLMYLSGDADEFYLKLLSTLLADHKVKPVDALNILLAIALQNPEEIKERITYLTTNKKLSVLDAVDILGGLNEHDALIFMHLVEHKQFAPEIARAKFADKTDTDIMEMRMIESPTTRPLF